MTVQQQTISGNGTLRDGKGAETPVRYSITIQTTVVRRPGLPPAIAGRTGRGAVTAAGGQQFVDGFYHLKTAEGQQMKLQKLGTEWIIVANVP